MRLGPRIRARLALPFLAAALSLLTAVPSAQATFHEILVREVYAGGAGNDSYVVLQAYSAGQNLLGGHSVTAYNASGTAIGTFTFSGSVPNGQNQMTVLIADTAYPTGFPSGPAADGSSASFNLDPAGGAVCWAGLDCMSWGSFGGATTPSAGAPADPTGIPAGKALRRTIAPNCSSLLEFADDSDVSSADFSDATPNPRANASTIAETVCPPAPNTTIGNPKPAIRTNSTEASFSFTASPPEGASFQCKLDTEPNFTACVSPKAYTGLTGGAGSSHTFQVRAVSGAGTDPSPASYAWTVDTVAPTATIDTKPANPSPGASAAFTFHASEASTFQCSMVPFGDPASFSACASGKTYGGLANGEYSFEVRATDQATNVGTPTAYSWEVDNGAADTTPPQTAIETKPPDPSTSSTASFTYSSNEPEATFECALDAAAFAACPLAGISYSNLANGPHSFQVRAIDASDNVDPTPAGYSFSVAVAPSAPSGPVLTPAPLPPLALPAVTPTLTPGTTLTAKPAAVTRDRTPSFRFRSDPPGAGFECALDRQPFKPCRSPFTTKSLKPGRHGFAVRAVTGGLADRSPAKFSFRVVAGR